MTQFRVDIHIRVRGQAPFEFCELKSEQYDDLAAFYEAVTLAVEETIEDYEGDY